MEIYISRPGDTLGAVARRFGVNESRLAYINHLGDPRRLTAGLALVIPSAGDIPQASIELAASVFPSIPDSALSELLPSLSFLFSFCRRILPDGTLSPMDDERLRRAAAFSHALPMLTVSNVSGDGYSGELAHRLLSSDEGQQTLLDNILSALEEGGYKGLHLNFGALHPFDRDNYNRFLRLASKELHASGYWLITAVAPREHDDDASFLCAAHDYRAHGLYADRVVLLAYDWGNSRSAPQAVSPVGRIRAALDYAQGKIPAGKLLLGMSGYGYNWSLPWRQGDSASPLFHSSAVNLAVATGAEIRFDPAFQASFFSYTGPDSRRHLVWFEDVRSIRARMLLVKEYGLAGICHWAGNRPNRPGMIYAQSLYSGEKLI